MHKGQLGRIAGTFTAAWRSRFGDKKFERYVTTSNQADLKLLGDLIAEGRVTPFVEKPYPMAETPEALRDYNEGHARGKLVIKIDGDARSADALTTDEYVLATGLCAAERMRSVGRTMEMNR